MAPLLSFRDLNAVEARLTLHVSRRLVELAELRPGQRVLDVGCGAGEPALAAARCVGPTGEVYGVDASAAAVALAREKAAAAGLDNARFDVLSAEALPRAGPPFDAALSRWCLQYLASADAALAAARARLAPGAPVAFATWAEASRLAWWRVPRAVTSRFAALPPVDPRAPGASRLASRQEVQALAARAGLELVSAEELETAVFEAESAAEVAAWTRAVFRSWVEAVPSADVARWEAALAEAVPREGGRFRLGGTALLFLARA